MALEQDLRSKNAERWEIFNSSPTVLRSSIYVSLIYVSLILVSLLFSACAPIRPVVKIGLVAPFEGLYRRSGYEALDATRMAIDESQSDAIDLLPVALDGTADGERTRRAVEKLLTDDTVQAIIGPLSPARVADVSDLLIDQPITWIVPYAIDPDGGFADPITSNEWATGLISAVAAEAAQSGAERLTLAGNKAGWPDLSDEEWSTITGLDVVRIGDLDDLATDDALFWMGSAADGAAYLNELRSRFPELPFWLGPQGEDPIFAERAQSMHKVHWATWVDMAYNDKFSDESPASPGKVQIYRATVVAAKEITDEQAMAEYEWSVQMFVFGDDGTSTPLAPK